MALLFSTRRPAGHRRRRRGQRERCQLESLENRALLCSVANPTVETALAGDANLDGVFDSSDLVTVFAAGKYERNEPASWTEGDWNRDARFTSSDLVTALTSGCYGQVAPQQSEPILLRPRTVFDPAFGLNASTVMVPDGWLFQGNVQFGGPPNLLLSGFIRSTTPDRMTGMEAYQADANLTWTVGPLGTPPIGQFDPRGFVFAPPVVGLAYFQQNLLPTLRGQHPDYEVLRLQQEPGLINAQSRASVITNQILGTIGAQIEFDAISVLARYRINGQWIEESFTAVFQYTHTFAGAFTSTDWGLIGIERTFAPQGTLAETQPLLRTIARSSVPNRDWWIALNNQRAALQGVIRNSQQDFANFVATQNTLDLQRDAIHQDFVQFIRGTDVFQNPFTGETSELASEGSVWFSSTGNIVVNADPSFNPNTLVAGNWRRAN